MFANPYGNPAPRPRHQNPAAIGPAVGLALGIVGLGVAGVATARVIERRAAPPVTPGPAPTPPRAPLSGLYSPGATFPDESITLPIAITTRDDLSDLQQNFPLASRAEALFIRSKQGDLVPLRLVYASPDGEVGYFVDTDVLLRMGIAIPVQELLPDIEYGDGSPSGALTTIRRLVTDLTHPIAGAAFEAAKTAVEQRDALFSEPSGTRDAFVRDFLSTSAPSVAWPAGPDELVDDSPEQRVWLGVDLISQIAYQTVWNRRSA